MLHARFFYQCFLIISRDICCVFSSGTSFKCFLLFFCYITLWFIFVIPISEICQLARRSRSVRNSRAAALCLHRSFALRSSASLHPAQRALGSVMSQVKRCAQSGSSPRVLVIPKMQAKQKTMHCMVICFVGFRRLPTLPDRRQSSTIGV